MRVAPTASRHVAPAVHGWPSWSPGRPDAVLDLLSDVHLDEGMPRTFEAFAAHLRATPASAVLILGDLFEVWVGDDARCAGFERRCLQVLANASASKQIAFLPGNRDFLVGDAMLHECGIQRLPDPVVLVHAGQRLLLTHGDALCLDDGDYQRFRAQVRGAAWQEAFLSRSLPERREMARAMRDASSHHQIKLRKRSSPAQWVDVVDDAAVQWLMAAQVDRLIHGHTHQPGEHDLGSGLSRWVLGDWDMDHGSPRARLLRLAPAGLQWLDAVPAQASPA